MLKALLAKLGWEHMLQAEAVVAPYEREFPKTATEEDIYYCFRLLLDRNPGKQEWHGHQRTAGTDLHEIVTKFINSNEFKQRKLVTGSLAETGHVKVESKAGFQLYISAKDDVCGSLRDSGEYEADVTALLRKLLQEGMHFVDIGANIGYFSLLGAQLVGEQGRVVAIEPYPYNVKLLHLNCQLNQIQHVEILPYALAAQRSLMRYDDSAGNSGNIFAVNAEASLAEYLQAALVHTVRLDDVLATDKPVDVIKMDIEGAEYLALQGMQGIIQQSQPVIISELSEGFLQAVSAVSMQEYLECLLQDETYQLAIIRGVDALQPMGRDIAGVIEQFLSLEAMCMDIVAYPLAKQDAVLA